MDEEEVAVLIEKILREGLLPLEGLPMVMAEGGRMINRKGRVIIVSAHGRGLMEQLVDGLRADQTVDRTLSASDQAVWQDVEVYAAKAILADEPTPGSGGDHVREFTRQALESSGCWAVGKVVGRQDSIQMIVREELSVAYDVLRSFALYVGIDPDYTYVGLPHSNDVSSALVCVPRGAFVWPNARIDTRQPYVLSRDRVERLRDFDLFQRACEIVRKETLTRMEEQTQLAILQFGLSSRLERPGARLVNYLTVLETVLGGEK